MARLGGGIVSAVFKLVYHLHPTFVAHFLRKADQVDYPNFAGSRGAAHRLALIAVRLAGCVSLWSCALG